jgi:hypothetical protein
MKKIQKLLNEGKYPIVHLSSKNEYCPDCHSSSREHCTHYIVITSLNYSHKVFTCKLVTHSSCCGNIFLHGYEYELNNEKPELVFNFISTNEEIFTMDCLFSEIKIYGHFKYLPEPE